MLNKAPPTYKPHPLVTARIERLLFITTVVINPVPTAFEVAAKSLIFLVNFSLLSILPEA